MNREIPHMSVKGVVVGYHRSLPRYAIRTDTGYVVLDVEWGTLVPQQIVSGPLDQPGPGTLKNETTGEPVEVNVEVTGATKQAASLLLRE
jgi:hypothetical protein